MRRLWRKFWDRAPRQLEFTREGRVIVAIALVVGFAAINTGNNLLFLAWGLVLSAIVVSGILSEGVVRSMSLVVRPPQEARVGENTSLPLTLRNTSRRWPAYGVELHVEAKEQSKEEESRIVAPYQLRIAPGASVTTFARFSPKRRGRCTLGPYVSSTRFPFGFFVKSRRLRGAFPEAFWIYPARVEVSHLLQSFASERGESAATKVGLGEEFFSLRPFRSGDDPRRINWKRSARSGRWVSNEYASREGRRVCLVLCLDAHRDYERDESGISIAGSLAERLLEDGLEVGLEAGNLAVPTQGGEGQRAAILGALAQFEPGTQRYPATGVSAGFRVGIVVGQPALAGFRLDTVVSATEERTAA